MKIFSENLFFRRKERMDGKEKDYYEYEIPENVKWQIIHIIFENIDVIEEDEFEQKFAKELGLPTIFIEGSTKNRIKSFILKESTEKIISLIEFLLQFKMYSCQQKRQEFDILEKICLEINTAFRINKIGYEIVPVFLEDDIPFIIVPIYSKHLHVETIKRPITLILTSPHS